MAALFLAGYVPGILWAVCCMIVGVILATRKGYGGSEGKYDWKNLGVCTMRAIPDLSLIVVVIGGIVGGISLPRKGQPLPWFMRLCWGFFTGILQ